MYDGLEATAKKQSDAARAKRNPNTKPNLPLRSYAGKYSDPFYGEMEVTYVNDKLRLTMSKDRSADLEHWHFDTFVTKWSDPWRGEGRVSFQINPGTGEAEALNVGGAVLRRITPAQ